MGVAGVQTPAFVERPDVGEVDAGQDLGVAGVQTPAFVERARSCRSSSTPRWCRRGSDSGLR